MIDKILQMRVDTMVFLAISISVVLIVAAKSFVYVATEIIKQLRNKQ